MKLSQLRQLIREEAKRALNEGMITNTIKPSLEGDVKVAVQALEKLILSAGAVLNNKNADKLADCIIDIIDAAKQEARDEYND